MESAIDALPPGTKVRWLEMRGEALLGVSLPEQAFASFVRCFEVGMATMLTVYLPCTYTYLVHVHAHIHVHVPCTMSMSMSMSMFHVPCTMSMPCPYAPTMHLLCTYYAPVMHLLRAYRFEAGMAECGIELLAQATERERDRERQAHARSARRGHGGLLGHGALLGQGLAKIMRDHARLVKRRSKGADGGLAEEQVPGARSANLNPGPSRSPSRSPSPNPNRGAGCPAHAPLTLTLALAVALAVAVALALTEEQVPGARSGLRAHTALARALLERAAADAADAAAAVARLDAWSIGEHVRPSLLAAAGLPLCTERLLTQVSSP
jgi:hypothetical protein